MAITNLGPIAVVYKGDWASGTYKKLNSVRHNKAVWLCIAPTTTEEPGAGTDWILAVMDGYDSTMSIAWHQKISNVLAEIGLWYLMDSTGGSLAVTLPASPSAGESVYVCSGPAADSNPIELVGNGNTINDDTETFYLYAVNGMYFLVFDGNTWLVVGGGGGGGGPTLQGDTAPYVTQTKTYQITNYNSFSSYAVSASAGTASISGDTITYTAPSTAGSVDLTLTVDGQPTVFDITVQAAPPYIPTPTPTPDNFGDPLEGGFYAGMIWNQLAQSSTSMDIATGSKTFTVPGMTNAPIVYQGQMVEVRSRANPANKFIGTVTEALGTNLTINVTSIGGSGTFSDWSIMARHRLIVAPKASGEHAGIALKNANSELPTACQTLTEGFAATQAMRDADSSTVYPAAHWARNLNIGGRTDWYIPARDELELCWRNLKPVTDNNFVTANRPTAASFSYANNGSYGDTANTNGTNNNSSPTGAAYTTTVPAQTTATAFRTGGAEAYEFGSTYYWSCSDYSASAGAWFQNWHSSNPGCQNNVGKAGTCRVRAVRRSVI